MPFRIVPTSFSTLKAAGKSLISYNSPIANKAAAMNGQAYSTPNRIEHHLNVAKTGGSPSRDFLAYGSNKVDYLSVPNGGIYKPQDIGIWGGKLFRVSWAPPRSSEAAIVDRGLSGAWWLERAAFLEIVRRAQSPGDLLDWLRTSLALGSTPKLEETKIVEASVAGPIACYMGKGNPVSAEYNGQEFPILLGDYRIKQLYIPGIRDEKGNADKSVSLSAFEREATNTYDAVGLLAKYGSPSNEQTD